MKIIKDKTILDFIERLKVEIDFNEVELIDYWKADLCAIGIKKRDKLVYISTHAYINKESIRYDFDLEILSLVDDSNLEVFKRGRKVSEKELICELKTFFKL